ncbi:MAG: glycosyltransferase family 2 protein [Chloroflexi bacterium]|nr:glycosyltransferase family 2 protein [Chloroflexota bacterium]
MKIVAVIPCLNEERFISDVVFKTLKHVDRVIVIDDGSKDSTARLARDAGAEVISHTFSQGAGAATRTGFEAALRAGASIIVTLDGDGQHNPDEIPLLLSPIIQQQADLVIGSRFLTKAKVSLYRKFGIDAITFLYNAGHIVKINDAQSGFRAYSRKAVERIKITDTGFGFSIETLVQVRKYGLTICEVPITCIYHDSGSTQHPVIHGLSIVWAVIWLRLIYEVFQRK